MRTFGRYRNVLQVASARWVFLSTFAVTFASSARTLSLVFQVKSTTHSLAAAGLVVASSSIGAALCAPIRGRLVDAYGQTRVLVPMTFMHMTAWIFTAVFASRTNVMTVLAFIGGASFPPVFACLRSVWSTYYSDDEASRTTAYSMTSMVQSTGIVLGPVAAAIVATFSTPRTALISAVCVTSIGAFVFAGTRLSRSVPSRSVGSRNVGSLLRRPGLQALSLSGLFFGVQLGILDVAIPGVTLRDRVAAGILLALSAIGQIVGAFVYGDRQWPGSSSTQIIVNFLSVAILGALLVETAHNLPIAAAIVLIQGLSLGMIEVIIMGMTGNVAPPEKATEAFTWIASGQLVGLGMGSSIAGSISTSFGAGSAFLAMTVVGAIASLVVFSAKRYLTAPKATRPTLTNKPTEEPHDQSDLDLAKTTMDPDSR